MTSPVRGVRRAASAISGAMHGTPQLCWNCLTPGAPRWRGLVRLCPACLARLCLARRHGHGSGQTPAGNAVTPLYTYQGLVRTLVLRAKVSGDQRALALIEEALATAPSTTALLSHCDAIMASPSSLWGRWHGRLDIPGCVAVRLAIMAEKPLISAPPWLFWRWRKRALSHDDEAIDHSPPPSPRPRTLARWRRQLARRVHLDGLRVLIVDDVVTTGRTLDELAATLRVQGLIPMHALTFACAPAFATRSCQEFHSEFVPGSTLP